MIRSTLLATGCVAALAFAARDFDGGNTAVAISAIGLAVASPVFYELDALPPLLQPLAWLSPFTHVAPLLRAVLAGSSVPAGSFAATLALGLALNVLSYRMARWQQ